MTRPAEAPPLPQTPFKLKGNVYHGTIEFFEASCPGGYRQLVDSVGDPALAEFLRQIFVSSAWYEATLLPRLVEAEAKVLGLEPLVYLERRSRWQAERDISGVYRMLLRLTSPELVAARLPRAMMQMVNFGKAAIAEAGPKRYRGQVTGFPEALKEWFGTAVRVYAETALSLAGASNPSFRVTSVTPEPSHLGHAMCTMHIEMSWS